ncbi:MAG: hypothetical protein G01um101416_390 [Microgenomates group bacterium Gr01-1014_16]|nr:MAG: hypothetical protein G01um101416_390 [Microgenomates group bacterium Gr01-1014_16]
MRKRPRRTPETATEPPRISMREAWCQIDVRERRALIYPKKQSDKSDKVTEKYSADEEGNRAKGAKGIRPEIR